jgi:hypothetical protein
MRNPFCRACILLTLVLSLGLHWTVLQSAAWVSMVVSFSQEGTMLDALEKTFDGEHPCPLCKVVERGTAESGDDDDTSSRTSSKKEIKKIDLLAEMPLNIQFFGSRMSMDYSISSDVAQSRALEPSVPPPQRA